jgi:subtilase family serine protease
VRRRFLATLLPAAAAVAVLAWSVAGASGDDGTLRLPAIKGPLISSLPATAQASGVPCPFVALGYACRSPYELGRAYDFPDQDSLDGSGQTIMIVDAYGSPTIEDDLASFDAYYGIPAPPSFDVVNAPPAPGSTGGSGDTADWAIETSLDVEYAHAMAPGAKLVLVAGASDDNSDLNAAEDYAFPQYPGAVVSQSFGDWETDPTAGDSFQEQHKLFVKATLLGDTIIASTGDAGATWTQYTGNTTEPLASYPASDPLVIAVGGTEGDPYPDGLYNPVTDGYGGEQVWNEADFDAATGGAPSQLFRAPFYQLGLTHCRTRTIPDVSYNAAILGGVAVFAAPNVYLVGGTSAGSPMWASIMAIANQARQQSHRGRLGFANVALYAIGRNHRQAGDDFHDITSGNNALDSTVGFDATPGYDLATGFGTPDVANLVGDLARSPLAGNPLFALPTLLSGNGSGHGVPRAHAAHTMIPG